MEPTQNALYVQWDYDFHLCRNFTVYLNGAAVHTCKDVAALTNCTIADLEAGVRHNVTVVATESYADPIHVSKVVNTLDPTMSM